MKRKEFLNNLILASIGASFLPLACKSNNFIEYNQTLPNFKGKVIIVGAGVSGLFAGYLLKKHNIDFEILEASSLYGGRVKKDISLSDFPIDLGAEWIHDDPSVLSEITGINSLEDKVDTIKYKPKSIYTYHGKKLRKNNWSRFFYSDHKFKNSSWFDFLENYIVPSIRDRIILNKPIKSIDYSSNKIILTDNEGNTYICNKVLVTVPINILKSNYINFSPAISSHKRKIIDSVYMPDGLKVFIKFSKQFYPDILFTEGLLSGVSSQDKLFYNAAYGKDTSDNILGLFTVGKKSSIYTELDSEEDILKKILLELDEIFDGKASKYYMNHIIQNWSKEPFIRGSYSMTYPDLNQLNPLNNRVYFAGEAFAKENPSTVIGAAESAHYAINKMLA